MSDDTDTILIIQSDKQCCLHKVVYFHQINSEDQPWRPTILFHKSVYFNVTEPLLRLCLWEVNLKFILCINYAQNTYAWCLYPIARKHSSRMRTAHLPTARVLVAATMCQNEGGGVSQVLGPGHGYTMGPGIPTPLGKLIPLDQFRHRHNYPLWTYSPWKYPSLSPGHTHPLLVTPGGHHWRHAHPYHRWTDRNLWKHYLPATSFAGGKKRSSWTYLLQWVGLHSRLRAMMLMLWWRVGFIDIFVNIWQFKNSTGQKWILAGRKQ